MRILFANDGANDGGGVQSYLSAVTAGLIKRGHDLAFLHCQPGSVLNGSVDHNTFPYFSVDDLGFAGALDRVKAFAPDVCYSHNMQSLSLEAALLDSFPVVKFMHGYFGTCISGLKTHLFPSSTPCAKPFGKACLLHYFPRHCGQVSAVKMVDHYKWAKKQNQLFGRYAAMLVASPHMKREYVANGMDEHRVKVNELFSPVNPHAQSNGHGTRERSVLFVGRMTKLKGGDILVRAVHEASKLSKQPVKLVMVGDGPQRAEWEQLARELNVQVQFTGWIDDQIEIARHLEAASLLAVPSLWPEPFGLVGLEAARFGIPAVAFDVGGISAWLDDGRNGALVPFRNSAHEEMGRVIGNLFSDPGRLTALGKGAKEKAAEMSLEKHLDKLEAILAEASIARAA